MDIELVWEQVVHMVKDFKLYEYNPGMETRIWSEDDRRRSKDFMEVIGRRLKISTLFRITCSSHIVKTRVIIRVLRIILVVLPEHPSDTYVFTMKMEILLEPTSNKLMVDDLTLILEILSRRFFLRLNLPDHRAAMIRIRAKTPSTSHPLPSSTPPLGTPPLQPIPLPTIYRAGVSEVTLPPWKVKDDHRTSSKINSNTSTKHEHGEYVKKRLEKDRSLVNTLKVHVLRHASIRLSLDTLFTPTYLLGNPAPAQWTNMVCGTRSKGPKSLRGRIKSCDCEMARLV
ncbi:hypothetical protein Tco_0602160 [Tanacetum coccineum]